MTDAIPSELRLHFRRVRTRKGHGGCGMWAIRLFILPHTLVGLGCLFIMPASVVWALFGTDHTATVGRVWTTSSKGKTTYHADYAYAHPTAGPQRGEATVSYEDYVRANQGVTTLPVRSIGPKPPVFFDTAINGRGGTWGVVGFAWLFGAFWNGVLSVFAYTIYYVPWRTRQLYKSGTPVVGRILSKRIRHGNKGGVTRYVRYAFTTAAGEAVEGESTATAADHDAAAEGAAVTVLYDPGKPKRNVAYEFGPYRCD